MGRLSIGRFCLMKIIKTFLPFFFQFYVIKDRTGVIMSKSFQRIKPTIDIFLNWPTDYVSVKERKIKKQQKRMERETIHLFYDIEIHVPVVSFAHYDIIILLF